MKLRTKSGVQGPDTKRGADGKTASLREIRDKVGGARGPSPEIESAAQPRRVGVRCALAAVFVLGLAFTPAPAMSQSNGGTWELINGRLQKRVNGVLSFMQFTLFPDVTTSSLSINNTSSGNPDFLIGQLGGGFTWSNSFPLYLEGNAAYSRFDPTFIATNGIESGEVSAKWTTLTGTVGVGWDFRLAPELVLRPIANFMIGHMETSASVLSRIIDIKTGVELEFLKNGNLNAAGFGGSLMLDYERYRQDYEFEFELRYTLMQLKSLPGTYEAVQGSYLAQNVNFWSRWRAPTGWTALQRPIRYVLEFTYSVYLENQDDVLGFNHLCSLGAGLELDSSAYTKLISRTRLMARYRFGMNVSGWAVGLGISF